ncbi:filamentous hemagglutinin N-terminal domain-containing protein, partial [Enterobacteriaceae bacterium RIT711]|nr:filamentous hemagglutinin N-terminal domain-containing protein [Enterobacteriaceae bacterium RIT711]
MNKNRYRLIFCKIRAFLIPVSEISSSVCSTPSCNDEVQLPEVLAPPLKINSQLLTLALLIAGALMPGFANAVPQPVHQPNIQPDMNASLAQRPQMVSGNNSVPVVNIAPPDNINHLSRNKFTELNSDSGLVFNNSATPANSQLAGKLLANPSLIVGKEANSILAEVTGQNPSVFKGGLEVAGKRADLLIVNPNGLTMSGTRFLNTQKVTVAAGSTAIRPDGRLQISVDDQSGRIILGEVDLQDSSFFDVVARGIELTGKIDSIGSSADIQMVAGLNNFTPDDHMSQSIASTSVPSAGQIGISGTAAGSMYGRNITLISTESGAGVRHDGLIKSLQDISISAEGDVSIDSTESGHNTQIMGTHDIALGDLNASGTAVVAAKHDLQLAGGSVGQSGVLGNLTLEAGNLIHIDTSVISGSNIDLHAHDLTVSGGVDSSTLHAVVDGTTTLSAQPQFTYFPGRQPVPAGSHIMQHDGKLQVYEGGVWKAVRRKGTDGMLSAGNSLNLETNKLVNNAGMIQTTAGDINILANQVDNYGSIYSGGITNVSTKGDLNNDCVTLSNGTSICDGIQASKGVSINTTHLLNNTNIMAGDELVLTLNDSGSGTNNGSLLAGEDIKITGNKTDFLNEGTISAAKNLLIGLEELANNGVVNAENITLFADVLDNQESGNVAATANVDMQVGQVDNTGSIAGNTIKLKNSKNLLNHREGSIRAVSSLGLSASQIITKDNSSLYGNSVLLNATKIINNDTAKINGNDITLSANNINNTKHASVHAAENLNIYTTLLVDDANNGMQSDLDALLDIAHGHDLTIDNVTYTPIAKRLLKVHSDNLYIKSDAQINNPGSLELDISSLLDNDAGSAGGIVSGIDMTVNSMDVHNHNNAHFWSAGNTIINVRNDLVNDLKSTIESQKNLSINSEHKVINNSGTLKAIGNVNIDAASLENNSSVNGSAVLNTIPIQATEYLYGWGLTNIDYYGFKLAIPELSDWNNTLSVTDMGNITAGGNLSINQHVQLGNKASVVNRGLLQATQNISIDGDLENSSNGITKNLLDVLKDPKTASSYMAAPSKEASRGIEQMSFDSLYALFNYFFNGSSIDLSSDTKPFVKNGITSFIFQSKGMKFFQTEVNIDASNNQFISSYGLSGLPGTSVSSQVGIPGVDAAGAQFAIEKDRWVNSLKKLPNSSLMNSLFGGDWKAQDFDTLKSRWNTAISNLVGGTSPSYSLYGDKPTEILAGGNYSQGGGKFTTGINDPAKANGNATVDVKVGNHSLSTLQADMGTSFNAQDLSNMGIGDLLRTLNSSALLDDLTSNKLMFSHSTVSASAGSPLYITTIPYIDQAQYHGADYFFNQFNKLQSNASASHGTKNPILGTGTNLPANVNTKPVNNTISNQTAGVSSLPNGTRSLGDAYFEHELINNTLMHSAGRLYSALDENSRIDVLMNNAQAEAIKLNLTPGVALTLDQYNNLSQDIVWYEPQVVDGVKVLAPHVYLCKDTLDAMQDVNKSGSLLAAEKDIQIDATNVNLLNSNISASGKASVHSDSDIVISSTTGADASISGHDVDVVAKNNINLTGVTLLGDDTDGNVSLNASENINMQTNMVAGNNDVHSNHDSNITSHDVTLKAGSNVNITGSDVIATGTTDINTKGNINIGDVHETTSSFSATNSNGILSHTETQITTAAATSSGSHLQTDQLKINSARDFNIEGSDINSHKSDLKVEGNLVAKTGQDADYSKTEIKETKLVVGASAGAAGYEASAETSTGEESSSSSGASPNNQDARNHPGMLGGRSNATAGRGETSGARYRMGISITDDTHEETNLNNHNSQLDFGSGNVVVGKNADFGGADVNNNSAQKAADDKIALPDLNITANTLNTTKYDDEHTEKDTHEETFLGYSGEAHSAILDVVASEGKVIRKSSEGMDVDPGLETAQVIGEMSQLAMGELAGVSATLGMTHEKSTSNTSSTSENITHFGGNMNITATDGDINLNGVDLNNSDHLKLTAAKGDVNINAAKSTSSYTNDSETEQAGLTLSAGTTLAGSGGGISLGASGSKDHTENSGTSYINSHLNSKVIEIATNNLVLKGANINAGTANIDVKGKTTIESVQDILENDHTSHNWNASVGVAVSSESFGLPIPTGSGGGGGGHDWEHKATTGEQSGIHTTNALNLKSGGDLDLIGAHVTSADGSGSVDIGGKVNATVLHDHDDKDGFYAGAGAGISKNGMATVQLEGGRVDRIHDKTDQLATIGVTNLKTGSGIQGDLNRDGSKTEKVLSREHVAGNDIKIVIDPNTIAHAAGRITRAFTRKNVVEHRTLVEENRTIDGPEGDHHIDGRVDHIDPPKVVERRQKDLGVGGRIKNTEHLTRRIQKVSADISKMTNEQYKNLSKNPIKLELPTGENGSIETHIIRKSTDLHKLDGVEITSGLTRNRTDVLSVKPVMSGPHHIGDIIGLKVKYSETQAGRNSPTTVEPVMNKKVSLANSEASTVSKLVIKPSVSSINSEVSTATKPITRKSVLSANSEVSTISKLVIKPSISSINSEVSTATKPITRKSVLSANSEVSTATKPVAR